MAQTISHRYFGMPETLPVSAMAMAAQEWQMRRFWQPVQVPERRWAALTRVSAAQRLSGTCTGCQNRRICHSCAAMAMAETGSVSGIPKYLCEMVWAMRTEAARLLAERQKPTT